MSITDHGYKLIYINGKNIYEHRHVMETHLGRPLKTFEIVHHKDGNRLNNEFDNLEIMIRSDHNRLHYFSDPKKIEAWRNGIMQKGIDVIIKKQKPVPEAIKNGLIWRKYYFNSSGKRKNKIYITNPCPDCGSPRWYIRSKKVKPKRICKHRIPS